MHLFFKMLNCALHNFNQSVILADRDDVTNIRYNTPLDLSEILNWVLGDERHGLHGARHLASVDPLVRIEGYGEEEGSAAVPFNHQP